MRIKSGFLINVLGTLIFLPLSANVFSQAEESWHPSKETLDKLSKDQPESIILKKRFLHTLYHSYLQHRAVL